MQTIKFLLRMLITFHFSMAVLILGMVVAWNAFDQIIAWALWEKLAAFIILILPYLLYLAYTQTKAYQIPQLKFLSRKLLNEVIAKDRLEAFPSVPWVKMGQFWLEVTRYGIFIHQKKYIKLDLLAGICLDRLNNPNKPETRGSTTCCFIDVSGKIIILDCCTKMKPETARALEAEIIRRSNAKSVPYAHRKEFAVQCEKSFRAMAKDTTSL